MQTFKKWLVKFALMKIFQLSEQGKSEKKVKYFVRMNKFCILVLKHPIWSALWDVYEWILNFKYKAGQRDFWNVLKSLNSKTVSVDANRYLFLI